MKTHIVRRREGETLSDYVTRWVETEREIRAQDERKNELVPEESPFGDYYVPRAKRDRSRELKETLDALNRDLDRRYQRDQQDRANLLVVDEQSEPPEI